MRRPPQTLSKYEQTQYINDLSLRKLRLCRKYEINNMQKK